MKHKSIPYPTGGIIPSMVEDRAPTAFLNRVKPRSYYDMANDIGA